MKKRLLSLALSVTFLGSVSLTGCGGTSGSSGSQPTPAAVTASQTAGADSAVNQYDPFGKYNEPVTVTAVLSYGEPTDPNVPKDITPETNSFVKVAKEKMNIEIKYLWSVPPDQYDQKFGVSMASGDLPDIMSIPSNKTMLYENLKNNDMLADLTEAFKYASPPFKKYVERDQTSFGAGKAGEKLTAIIQYWDPRRNLTMMFIRNDWLKELDLQIPQTMDELKTVARAFVDKKGVAGLGMSKKLDSWGFDIKSFMYGFGAYPKKWIMGSDGTLVPGEIQPQVKTALEYFQTLYKEGLIDEEFAMQDENKIAETAIAGNVGILFGPWWLYEWPLNQSKDKDDKAEWVCAQVPSADAQGKTVLDRVTLDSYKVVNKNCKNPEAVIKLFNLSCEFDEEHYGVDAKGEGGFVWNWVPTAYGDPFDINTTYEKFNKAIDSNDEKLEGFTGQEKIGLADYKAYLDYKAGNGKWDSKFGGAMARSDKEGGWAVTRSIFESGNVAYGEFYGPATSTQQEKGAQLDKMTEETYLKIIMGASPISEFDSFAQKWKELGGDQVTAEVNDWYMKNKN